MKDQDEVLICELRLNKEGMVVNNDVTDGFPNSNFNDCVKNVPEQLKNVKVINLFSEKLTKEIKPKMTVKDGVSNKTGVKKQSPKEQNPKSRKNKRQNEKEKSCTALNERHDRGLKNLTALV